MWIKDGKPWDGEPLWGADGYWIFHPTDAQMRESGYVWVEPPAPEPPPKKYSRLKIVRKLGESWPNMKTQIEAAGLLEEFNYADYLDETDEHFAQFLRNLPQELKEQLNDCLWED